MHVLALTGGIATGKTTLVGLLADLLPEAEIFDCDASVDRLLGDAECGGKGHRAWSETVRERDPLSDARAHHPLALDDRLEDLLDEGLPFPGADQIHELMDHLTLVGAIDRDLDR